MQSRQAVLLLLAAFFAYGASSSADNPPALVASSKDAVVIAYDGSCITAAGDADWRFVDDHKCDSVEGFEPTTAPPLSYWTEALRLTRFPDWVCVLEEPSEVRITDQHSRSRCDLHDGAARWSAGEAKGGQVREGGRKGSGHGMSIAVKS